MKETILLLSGGLLAGIIVMFIKDFIFKKFKEKISTIVPEAEKFSGKKLADGMLNVTSSVGWAKDIASIFNLRKLIIIGVIIGCIYGYGWWKGHQGLQPVLDWHGKEEWVSLNDHYLHVKPDGSMEIVASDKTTILKKLTVKDFENLKKNSRPYGFRFKPFATVGGSVGELKTGFEAGLGVDFAKWYKYNANVFLTNLGAYLGVGYNLTENFDIMLGYGKGYRGDNRAGIFGKFRF
jgi:hypothetical protein